MICLSWSPKQGLSKHYRGFSLWENRRPARCIGVFSLDIRDYVLVSLFLRFITHIFSPKFIASGMNLFHT
nr:MAG TPA: hypothetical protein [Caudoviricetes sp.]